MPCILLIRPAQTVASSKGLIIGRSDFDLDSQGQEEARAICAHYVCENIRSVAVSPEKRAVATAMPLCQDLDLLPKLVKGFRGIDRGDWEGLPKHQVFKRDGLRYEKTRLDPDFPCPGGESIRNVFRRAFPELIELVSLAEPGQTILVVAPHHVIKTLVLGALSIDLSHAANLSLDHASSCLLTRSNPDGLYQLKSWNDRSHLKISSTCQRTTGMDTCDLIHPS